VIVKLVNIIILKWDSHILHKVPKFVILTDIVLTSLLQLERSGKFVVEGKKISLVSSKK